jgi:hypothetical protein
MSAGNDDPGTSTDEASTSSVPKVSGWAQAAIPGLGAGKPKSSARESAAGAGPSDGSSVGATLLAKSRNPVVAGVIIVVVIGGILLGLTWGAGHSSTSASYVEYTVLNQVQGTAKGQFHDPSVVTMSCDIPSTWKSGEDFTCKGFKANSTQVAGVYRGTVTIVGANQVAWSGSWTASS